MPRTYSKAAQMIELDCLQTTSHQILMNNHSKLVFLKEKRSRHLFANATNQNGAGYENVNGKVNSPYLIKHTRKAQKLIGKQANKQTII